MAEQNNIEIIQVSPVDFEYQNYDQKDKNLLSGSYYDTSFTSSTAVINSAV